MSASLASKLPTELILSIVDTAIVQNRVENVSWCLKLSLVCSTFRASVLPLVYKVLFLDVTEGLVGGSAGWHGSTGKNSQIAFLTWLLNDPTAPPRQHVKHIILRTNLYSEDIDLEWTGPQTGAAPPQWSIEQLTIRYRGHAMCLHRAGLRPRKTFYLRLMSSMENVPRADFTRFHTSSQTNHNQTWAGEPEISENDGLQITRFTQQRATRLEIDLTTSSYVNKNTLDGTPLTIQLYDGDFLHHFPDQLLDGLVAVFMNRPDIEVVLACSVSYKIRGQTIEDFIQGASHILPAEAVEARLRISHEAWVPRAATRDIFSALMKAEVRGTDPWDRGHV